LQILDLLAECCKSTNKSARLAYATLVLNYAVSLVESKDDGGQIQVLSAALEMAGPQEQDVEVQFRALVAIGTLVSFSQMFGSLIFFHAYLSTGIESVK
jgi:phospholipase A-2-activating protein